MFMKAKPNSRPVYSTEKGRICPGCQRPQATCICKSTHPTLKFSGDGVVRLHRETKGRKGKGVTLVTGLDPQQQPLATVAKLLKSKCGVGGSVKENVIELQSADREKIKQILEGAGYTVKVAGG